VEGSVKMLLFGQQVM